MGAQPFTTRPEVRGTFGVVASTHWIASAVAMGVLERGGNAFDAACAAGFTLQVVEPHLNGPGGDMPVLLRPAGGAVRVLCAQGTAPAAATIAHYRAEGLNHIPGAGLLATVVPGAFAGWCRMLRDHGTWEVADVLAPAIHYAAEGHPVLPRVSAVIAAHAALFTDDWTTSAALWLPGGKPPAPHSLLRNPDLAATWRRVLAESAGAPTREARIEAARRAFYEGFVAEAIDGFVRKPARDATGERRAGVLRADDMAAWHETFEAPVSATYGPWTVHKTGAWGQGPVLHQAMGILRHAGIDAAEGADFVHLVVEAIKLAFADREAYYGDSGAGPVPLDILLSDDYARARAALIGPAASLEHRPGPVPGHEALARAAIRRAAVAPVADAAPGTGEPTMGHLAPSEGDTCHLDVIDRHGNAVSATPSGGWLQSSPVVAGLGFALNTRAQMFWLEPGLASSLMPGRRPRTTLSPSLATAGDGATLCFGTPGGDQQDQWQLVFLLRLLRDPGNLQAIMDAPLFHSLQVQTSFDPRRSEPGRVMIETSWGDAALTELARRGHRLTRAAPWSLGRLTAAGRAHDGSLRAAATPALMQAYAIGR